MRRVACAGLLALAVGMILPSVDSAAAAAQEASPPDRPVVSGLRPGIDLTSPEALGWTREQHATALRYSRERWIVAFVDPLWGMASLALLIFTGMSGRMAAALRRVLPSRLASDAIFIVLMVLTLAALNFPLEIHRFLREHRYGFSTQGFGPWFADELKGLAVACIGALLFLVPVWTAIRRWPRSWWIAGSAIGIALSILVMAVAPVFIAPLFNTFTPLRDDALRTRILDLAHREGIPADDVWEVDASRQSRHDNAYVAGLLGTQRIVLYDTLLAAYTPDEIAFVMGHEMGHYAMNHIWKGIGVAAIAIVAGFFLLHRLLGRAIGRWTERLGFEAAGSIAAVPLALLILSAYMFLIEPATNAFSRRIEQQADVFALETVRTMPGGRDVAVSSFQRMAARNLSDPNPPAFIEWWLYSHPSMRKRIRFCADY